MNPLTGKALERVPDSEAGRLGPRSGPPAEEISLIALVNVVLRARRLLVAVPLALSVIVLIGKLLQDRTYTATASFIPQETEARSGGGLANVAAQFGFRVPSSRPSESPAFYEQLLRSRAILGELVQYEYSFALDGEPRRSNLIELYEIEGGGEALRREKAIRRLNESMGVATSRQTDIVQLSVRSTQPGVARQITERALALVNEFNLQNRQSYAREERTFVEGRLAEAREELRTAERSLGEFLQRNREFRNSAELTLRHDALQREVGMRQEIYTTLAEAYEQARIDEVRNIPVITILDPPEESVEGNARGTVSAVLFAAIAGFAIALLIALAREFLRSTRQRPEAEYLEFSRIRGEILAELRRPWRLVRREGGTSNRRAER